MRQLKSFIWLSILGGFAVVLPVLLFLVIFGWLFSTVASLIAPATALLTDRSDINEWLAILLVMAGFMGLCFVIGLMLRTRLGGWLHDKVDSWLVKLAPGYKTIREVVSQLMGGDETNLLNGEPALAKIYGPDSPVSVTAIVTSRHSNGDFTVFVPTAPIPTSGITYHLPASCVTILEGVSVEQAMRTIISCGSGSAELLESID